MLSSAEHSSIKQQGEKRRWGEGGVRKKGNQKRWRRDRAERRKGGDGGGDSGEGMWSMFTAISPGPGVIAPVLRGQNRSSNGGIVCTRPFPSVLRERETQRTHRVFTSFPFSPPSIQRTVETVEQ